MKRDKPKTYQLRGSTDGHNTDCRISLLSTLFENAKAKGMEIAQLRQRNLNYALIIFAGVLTFSFQFASRWYAVWVSAALFVVMIFFSLLDRRFHKYIHGWRGTEKMLTHKIASIINYPDQDVTFVRYSAESEKSAERFGLQPCITYTLVVAAGVHFAYCLRVALTS